MEGGGGLSCATGDLCEEERVFCEIGESGVKGWWSRSLAYNPAMGSWKGLPGRCREEGGADVMALCGSTNPCAGGSD